MNVRQLKDILDGYEDDDEVYIEAAKKGLWYDAPDVGYDSWLVIGHDEVEVNQ